MRVWLKIWRHIKIKTFVTLRCVLITIRYTKWERLTQKNLYLWRWRQIATLNHLLGRRRRPTEDTPSTTTPAMTHRVIWEVHGWLRTRLKRQRNDFFAMSSPPWCNFCTCFLLQKRKRRKLVRKTRLARMDGSFNIDATTLSWFYFNANTLLGTKPLNCAHICSHKKTKKYDCEQICSQFGLEKPILVKMGK